MTPPCTSISSCSPLNPAWPRHPAPGAKTVLIWLIIGFALSLPLVLAGQSPLLAWREPIYILAGFAGITAMSLLLLQPLLAGGALPGISLRGGRVLHRWIGLALLICVIVHVVGSWITSPPDVVDALLFVSATPFSVWGVIAMWAIFATAALALIHRRIRFHIWRLLHQGLAGIIGAGTIIHALLIEGTMETISKVALSALIVIETVRLVTRTKIR